ncbi:hypothetical protein AMTR_s00160p00060570 [Amborella trichopoda]|uniref:Uncharacterized protein n=1 Tax=Amborella trichopoda TaxID=13333 RepID=W1PTE5_AMBTC|nr:hypothetical protein AMTR_s00160p00060570 [Amborella trichopoda]
MAESLLGSSTIYATFLPSFRLYGLLTRGMMSTHGSGFEGCLSNHDNHDLFGDRGVLSSQMRPLPVRELATRPSPCSECHTSRHPTRLGV